MTRWFWALWFLGLGGGIWLLLLDCWQLAVPCLVGALVSLWLARCNQELDEDLFL